MVFPRLAERVAEIQAKISDAVTRGGHGQDVTLVAVTKTHGPEAAVAAWQAGIRDCGENRVQEALPKMTEVEVPVVWHLIGHLQRNKVESLDHFALFHALDSSRLGDVVCEFGLRRGRAVDALVQVNTSGEVTKGGFSLEELRIEADRLTTLSGVRVVGAMTMAPLDASESNLRATFSGARHARQVLAEAGHPATMLSMGMSNDYEIAVEEGATMVRLGTALFEGRGT
ncbi:MAG TPA: YggS family pyridoxal phosphate-dependent enzyme [Gemmatimonadaceae bacterium]|jgi:pyridoxal phosphate enzyme (YggS family)|nr:YggS family pyridoxal phosphate-dependent enzyme [Gemmatimonadaceae bacterium]